MHFVLLQVLSFKGTVNQNEIDLTMQMLLLQKGKGNNYIFDDIIQSKKELN